MLYSREDIQLYDFVTSKVITKVWSVEECDGEFLHSEFTNIFIDFMSCRSDLEDKRILNKYRMSSLRALGLIPYPIHKEARLVFLKKNLEYGGQWRNSGAIGASIEIYQKLARLGVNPKDRDALIDLFNYLIIFIMNLNLKNIYPRRIECLKDTTQ